MDKKVFSLFNTNRWGYLWDIPPEDTLCDCVPFLEGSFGDSVDHLFDAADRNFMVESLAAKKYGKTFKNPEGYMMFHEKAQQIFKFPINK